MLLSSYNGARWIEASVKSVLAQKGVDLELLVTDDGSSDDSRRILERFQTDSRVRFLDQPGRMGLYARLNLLAREARAPLLKPWCQDDEMLPDCLVEAVGTFANNPLVDCVYCACDEVDEDGVRHPSRPDATPELLPPADAAWYLLLHGCLAGNASNLFLRRSPFEEVGGFAENISGDYDVMEKLSRSSALARIAKPLTMIRRHAGQWSRREDSFAAFLDANGPIWLKLRGRLERDGDERASRASRALAEVVGRNLAGGMLRRLARGDVKGFVRLYRASRRFGSAPTLLRHLARRLVGRPRTFGEA